MGTVRKIGDEYYIEFMARGLKYQQKAGRDKKAAWKLLDEIEDKIRQGEMGVVTRDVDLEIFWEDFKKYARDQHTKATYHRFQTAIQHLRTFLAENHPKITKLSQVTPKIIESYKTQLIQKSIKPKVINLTLILLRAILEYAIKLGYLHDNATLHTPLVAVTSGYPPRILNDTDLQIIRQNQNSAVYRVVEFVLLTGMQVDELADLEWEDFGERSHRIRIKGREARHFVPFTYEVISLLEHYKIETKQRGKVFPKSVQKFLKKDTIEKEIKTFFSQCRLSSNYGYRTLTNTFAVAALHKGVALSTLYLYLGYADIVRVMRYASFMPTRREELYPQSS